MRLFRKRRHNRLEYKLFMRIMQVKPGDRNAWREVFLMWDEVKRCKDYKKCRHI